MKEKMVSQIPEDLLIALDELVTVSDLHEEEEEVEVALAAVAW